MRRMGQWAKSTSQHDQRPTGRPTSMTTGDERMGHRPVSPLPKLERLQVLWRIQAPTGGRVYECVLYRTDAGLELRMQRNEG
jgi:hypothetical protein